MQACGGTQERLLRTARRAKERRQQLGAELAASKRQSPVGHDDRTPGQREPRRDSSLRHNNRPVTNPDEVLRRACADARVPHERMPASANPPCDNHVFFVPLSIAASRRLVFGVCFIER